MKLFKKEKEYIKKKIEYLKSIKILCIIFENLEFFENLENHIENHIENIETIENYLDCIKNIENIENHLENIENIENFNIFSSFYKYNIEKLTFFSLIFKQLINPNVFDTQDLNFIVEFLTPFCNKAEKIIANHNSESLTLEKHITLRKEITSRKQSSYLSLKAHYSFASQNLNLIKDALEQKNKQVDEKIENTAPASSSLIPPSDFGSSISENQNNKKRKFEEITEENRAKKIKVEKTNSIHPSSFFAGKKPEANKVEELKVNLQNMFNHWESLKFSNNPSALLQKETITFGFIAHDVKRNGNCLFEAIVDQLKYISLSVHSQYSQADLRMKAIQYLIDHREVYENFVANQSFESFIQKMSTSGTWGEHIVLTALCHALNMSIVIINSDGSAPVILKKQNAPLTIYLGYEVGLHYQSLHCDNEIKPSKDIQKFFEAATFIEEPKSKLSLNQ